MKDSIIVLSGGLDSTTLLYEYQERIALAVSFDYGSKHNARELPFAAMHCQRLGGDHAIYPDCRPEFVDALDQAISAGTYNGVRLFTPYTHLTKADIARHGKALGIDYAETWSCYKGGEHHCGKCGTCTERIEALREAGVEDKTVYENV